MCDESMRQINIDNEFSAGTTRRVPLNQGTTLNRMIRFYHE